MTTTTENKQNGSRQTEEAYKNWASLYQQMTEEGMGLFRKSVETAQEMMPTPEAHQEMYRHWNDSFQQFMEKASVEGKAQDPSTYKELYTLWLENWSRQFDAYMRTPEFVENSGKNLEAFSDAKSQMGEWLEEYWHNLHLPSARDMREIYHKLYILERKQDAQDRKLDQINETLSQLLKAVQQPKNPVSPKKTVKATAKKQPKK